MKTDKLSQLDEPQTVKSSTLDIDPKSVSSVALARLVEEVRNEEAATSQSYDRVHNRHNR